MQFRRSKSFGPFRVTATKRGVSISGGIRGFRVSANSRGQVHRTVSLPGTGIYDRKIVRSTRRDHVGSSPGAEPLPEPADIAEDLTVIDATGGTRDLDPDDPGVVIHDVVAIPGGSAAIAGIAAAVGISDDGGGRVCGTRDGLVIDRGSRLDVTLLVMPEDRPKEFGWWARRSGQPRAIPAGRLSKHDESIWRSSGIADGAVRVVIFIDVTAGLTPVLQVRLRPALLVGQPTPGSQDHVGASHADGELLPVPPPMAPDGWYPDPTTRHELRLWDGRTWTSTVSDDGVTSADPM